MGWNHQPENLIPSSKYMANRPEKVGEHQGL